MLGLDKMHCNFNMVFEGPQATIKQRHILFKQKLSLHVYVSMYTYICEYIYIYTAQYICIYLCTDVC